MFYLPFTLGGKHFSVKGFVFLRLLFFWRNTMQNTQESKFFDLHTRGIGYLNRIREVTVRKGQPFMAVTVAALRGTSDDV